MRLTVEVGLILGLLLVPAEMSGQARDDRDPFVELHRRLSEAADRQLALVREARAQAEQLQTDSRTSFQADASAWSRFSDGAAGAIRSDARERLRTLRVDAARIFAEEGLGGALLNVADVESNFDALALSPKGARGVWQLMPETAARFGLRVDAEVDERMHAPRATRAAARYLRELYARFGEWRLALAAYNTGEGRVERAIAKAGARDYARLAGLLPEETRKYVKAVLGTGGRE